MPALYAGREAATSEPFRGPLSLLTGTVALRVIWRKVLCPSVAWLWLKDGALRSHFALKTGSQINRSLSAELFCTKSIKSNMTLSLISLLYKDIAELWLLLKKSTGVSSFSNFLSYLIVGQVEILLDNILLLRKMGCVLVQRQKYSFCVHSYNLLLWGCVLCPCVNLQYMLLFADVFLGTPDIATKSMPVFYTEGTFFRIHSCSDYGDHNCC